VSYSIRLRPGVLDDLREASSWYEERESGLGSELERCFFSALAKILREPEWFLAAYGNVRRVILDRFPYTLWFRIEADVVVVFLLWHAARSPQMLKRLLRQREVD